MDTATRPPRPLTLLGLLGTQALLQVLDLATTFLALGNGGVEANPVSRLVIARSWWAYAAIKLGLAAGFLGLWPLVRWLPRPERRFLGAALAAFAATMLGVVGNNAWILL